MMSKLAIIGTAGRKEDRKALTPAHYPRMVAAAGKLITHLNIDPKYLYLVSGGAAWSDHVAVTLGLIGVVPIENITVYLPAELDTSGFTGTNEWEEKVASTANYYHSLFHQITGVDGLTELCTIRDRGAKLIPIKNGFHARNTKVAQELVENGHLLAFTFGSDVEIQQPVWSIREHSATTTAAQAGLKDGGTADTFNKAHCKKFHCRLGPIPPEDNQG